VDEDWGVGDRCEDVEVVVVVAGDGEVPHPAVVLLRGDTAAGGSNGAVGGLEVLALLQFARGSPLLQIRILEQVVAGGVDDLGAVNCSDGEVAQKPITG